MSVLVALHRIVATHVLRLGVLIGLLGLVVTVPPAYAVGGATRTWVAGIGDDVNPCSRTAPCKTFGGAISKTAAGGEINALDPGGFGAVTITKAITIDGTPGLSGILSAGVTGVIVSAGANDIVVLRGLDINGAGTGVHGINFVSGKALFVENTVISGVTSQGINFQPAAGGELVVSNVDIRLVVGSGILASSTGGSARVTVDNTRIDNAGVGINARGNSRVEVHNSVVSNNAAAGLQSQPDAGTAELNADGVQSNLNGTGFQVGGTSTAATLRITNIDVFDNTVGITVGTNGTAYSFGDNRIAGNATGNGSPPALTLIPLQ